MILHYFPAIFLLGGVLGESALTLCKCIFSTIMFFLIAPIVVWTAVTRGRTLKEMAKKNSATHHANFPVSRNTVEGTPIESSADEL